MAGRGLGGGEGRQTFVVGGVPIRGGETAPGQGIREVFFFKLIREGLSDRRKKRG
jgi:hypothetical protein